MASDHFVPALFFRVILLCPTTWLLGLAATHSGYYATAILLTLLLVGQVFDLYRYVNKANNELQRFLSAARHDDFGQQFDSLGSGAGLGKLAESFTEIMAGLHENREQQARHLRHLQAMTTHIPVPLISLFPDGKITLHNNAARQLFGSVNVQRLDDLAMFSEGFVEALRHLKPGNRTLATFVDEGVERQLSLVMSQIVTGDISESLISIQDIQSELDVAQLQAWTDLVKVLTHEIMNSITPVASLAKTATELVDDTQIKVKFDAPPEVLKEDLQDIRSAVDTVARRSDSLMQFVQSYRSLTRVPQPKKQEIDLQTLFNRIKDLLVPDWAEQNIQLSINIEPPSLQLYADPDMLEQILINLLKNAGQALAQTEQPSINLTARLNQRSMVIICVEDNGPGIPKESQHDVFMPFYTTKQDGSGVGLALSRQIMIAHGGAITLGDSPLGGARFTLVF